MILVEDVVIEKISDDNRDKLHGFIGRAEFLHKLLEEFRLSFENLNLISNDILGLIKREILRRLDLLLYLLSNGGLEHVDLLVMTLLHEVDNGLFKVFVGDSQDLEDLLLCLLEHVLDFIVVLHD